MRHSPTQTWHILRQRLGWTRQRPARRAVERDDAAIEAWVKRDWPRIKRGTTIRRLDLLPGRKRILLLPVVRGTWAPRGQTPVLRHRFSWNRMSMAGVLAYRPDRSRAKLIFQTKAGSYNTDSIIEFLKQLRRHLRGKPVVLIWDGLSAHRSKDMKAWLATQHWLTVEQLPGYAHDLNPMELVWGNLKNTELANLCPDILDDADTAAHTGLHRIGSSYQLCFNFLDHTGLRL
ncbi:IS630 family transposase [Dactylosporangium cerinum]